LNGCCCCRRRRRRRVSVCSLLLFTILSIHPFINTHKAAVTDYKIQKYIIYLEFNKFLSLCQVRLAGAGICFQFSLFIYSSITKREHDILNDHF